MHEYAITKELLRLARETAEKNHLSSVKKIVLSLGALTSYEEAPIRHYFEELKIGGNYLKEAELIVEHSDGNDIKLVSVTGEHNGNNHHA